jgi:Mg-chelatase subunit ChlD
MKTKILAIVLVAATFAVVAFYPATRGSAALPPPIGGATPAIPTIPAHAARVEAVFVLDTTGSMSGLIAAAKEQIWSIARSLAQAQQAPEIAIGLVGYRDRGDAYVTKIVDLSTDLDTLYGELMDFAAGGGGDGPESVNRALQDAVNAMSWSSSQDTYKVVFLVGDAPPHMDYHDEARYPEIVAAAAAKGIVVNTIQCGTMPDTAAPWRHIAALGGGRYFTVGQAGSAVAVATPFDADLARLSAELDGTRMFYGSPRQQALLQSKVAATEKLEEHASEAVRARRGAFNASAPGAANFAPAQELLGDLASGRVTLDAVSEAELPPQLASVAAGERERVVAETALRREQLRRQIAELAADRDEFIEAKLAERGGAEGSLDVQIYEAVRDQAAAKGLRYEGGPRF